MLRRGPIKAKRDKPRRNEGRVSHGRIKGKSSDKPTAEEKRYWASLRDVCWNCDARDTVIHHILADAPGKVGRRDHRLVVRLCPRCHNMGTESVHLLGSEDAFLRRHGVDLVAIAVIYRDQYFGGNHETDRGNGQRG